MTNLEDFLTHDTVVPMKTLLNITAPEDCASLGLDINGSELSAYSFLLLRYTPGPDSVRAYGAIKYNSGNLSAEHIALTNLSSSTKTKFYLDSTFTMLAFPTSDSSATLQGISGFGNRLYYSSGGFPMTQLTRIAIGYPDDNTHPYIKAGSRFQIIGVL